MQWGVALTGLDGEERGSPAGQLEAELHAQVAEIVEPELPHGRGLEDHVAEDDGVLREAQLSGVAGAGDAEEVDLLAEAAVRHDRQPEGRDVEGRGEVDLEGRHLLRLQRDGPGRAPRDAVLGELAVGVLEEELQRALGPVDDLDRPGHGLVADSDAKVDVLHGHGGHLQLQLASGATHVHRGHGGIVDDKVNLLAVLHVVSWREDNRDSQ
mmetsp:Transcript_118120/g.345979  ORF Transcript_118120/g.345979 Transcript_118120/m.345979 type:complete len:211 (-) Transcript_118120:1791-2423(-)